MDIVYPKQKNIKKWVNGKKMDQKAIRMQHRLWPGAVVPFIFAHNLDELPDAKNIIKEAMTEWETTTCIRFVERTNENDYVEFAINLGCNADVGRRGGRQIVSLGNGCLHKSVVIHEIGHVIGFWHEQNRPDRDDYVHIYTENIIDRYKEAFQRFSVYRIDSKAVQYDYHSIMHYGMKAFTKNGKLTIVPKKEGVFTLGNVRLSTLDIKQANVLYECDRIDRGWTNWSRWTLCDKTCGGGNQERMRVCTSFKNGRRDVQRCPGSEKQQTVCNLNDCPAWPTFPLHFSFQESSIGLGRESECVLTYERADYQEWSTYSFCIRKGKRAIQMKWSDSGPISGMKCTQIVEPEEPEIHRWYDNYLCIPKTAPYNFTWSYNGPKQNMPCLQWYAKSGRDGWGNNYLCAEGETERSGHHPPPVIADWSQWTQWSLCTKKCGSGRQLRVRYCPVMSTSAYRGNSCKGESREARRCNKHPCLPNSCGGKLRGTKGVMYSPNYPANYPSDINCTWIIEGKPSKHILLTITSFDLEKIFDGPCKFDYLQIKDKNYKGPELGKFCGTTIPVPVVSQSQSLWVSMITDGEDNRAGFKASWELQESQPEDCGGLLHGVKGQITSPNYPRPYPPEKTCIWKIEVPLGYYVEMTFLTFDLERHHICKYDSVEIKDGWNRTSHFIGRYCDANPFRGVKTTRGNKALIKFVSDHSTEKRGFKMVWRALKKEVDVGTISVEEHALDGRRSCPEGWKYFDNTKEGGACYMVNKNYFNWYAARDDCLQNAANLVTITTKPEQEFVTKDLLGGNYMWLGITDEDEEGHWAWSDNSTSLSFDNWDTGDPNDGGRLKNEDCALIKPDGKWNDYPCDDRFNYICKRKPLEPWNVGLEH